MQTYFGNKATWLKERVRRLENTISLLSGELLAISEAIHSGSKSKQEHKHTFTVVNGNGKPQTYRLTITLDSLATSEKSDAGMTTTAKFGANIKQEE